MSIKEEEMVKLKGNKRVTFFVFFFLIRKKEIPFVAFACTYVYQ